MDEEEEEETTDVVKEDGEVKKLKEDPVREEKRVSVSEEEDSELLTGSASLSVDT